jgi:hypothetical protein
MRQQINPGETIDGLRWEDEGSGVIINARPEPHVYFTLAPEVDPEATKTYGFDVYRDIECVTIHVPDGKDIVSKRATPADVKEYPRAWERYQRVCAFKEHKLDLIPGISPAALATFKGQPHHPEDESEDTALHIHTMEQLVAFDKPLPDWLEAHRDYARRFLRFLAGVKPRYRLIDGQLQEVAA